MPPAIIGGVIAAVGTVGAAAIGSKKNSKAIKQAQQAQSDSTAAQIGYQREADAYNRAALSPWMARGNQAGDTIMAALGLGASTAPGAPYGQTVAPQQTPQQAATSAYEIFKQSTGYQSRFTEGLRALSSNYFGGGVGQSGAAVKAALRFGQDYASREFGNWMGALGNQQGLGFAGASALAGVSQGNADRLGQISQNNADAMGQAAIARAQNQGALLTGIAGATGQLAGALSSYSRPPVNYTGALTSNVPHYGYA